MVAADPFAGLRLLAPDIEELYRASLRFRAQVEVFRRHPNRARTREGLDVFARLCTDIRLQLRVTADYPAGFRAPQTEADALAYMKCPNMAKSTRLEELQFHHERSWTDPRVLITVDRAIADARALGVPLWPTALHQCEDWRDTRPGRRTKYATGSIFQRAGEGSIVVHKTAGAFALLSPCVQLGHAHHRELPWACWSVVDDFLRRAASATGYRLEPADAPGEYELSDNCPHLNAHDVMSLALTRNSAAKADELDRLLLSYSGGPWVDEHGEVHESGSAPDPRLVDRYGKVHATEEEAQAADESWTAPKPETPGSTSDGGSGDAPF